MVSARFRMRVTSQGRIQVLRKGGPIYLMYSCCVFEVGEEGVACMSIRRHSYRDYAIYHTKIFVI